MDHNKYPYQRGGCSIGSDLIRHSQVSLYKISYVTDLEIRPMLVASAMCDSIVQSNSTVDNLGQLVAANNSIASPPHGPRLQIEHFNFCTDKI